MTTTDKLIADLAAQTRPTVHGAAAWRIAGALMAGAVIALLALYAWLGVPLQQVARTGAMVFAVKLSYAAAFTGLAAGLALLSGRPGRSLGPRWGLLALPLLVIAAPAAMQLSAASGTGRFAMVFGGTWAQCLGAIVVTSIPAFVLMVLAFRRLAPTRLRVSGFLAGLSAGASASIAYALFCPETAAPFLLVWYTLAMLAPAVFGALTGQRLLRW